MFIKPWLKGGIVSLSALIVFPCWQRITGVTETTSQEPSKVKEYRLSRSLVEEYLDYG